MTINRSTMGITSVTLSDCFHEIWPLNAPHILSPTSNLGRSLGLTYPKIEPSNSLSISLNDSHDN